LPLQYLQVCFVRGGFAGPKSFLNNQSTTDIIASQLVDELYKCNGAGRPFKFPLRVLVSPCMGDLLSKELVATYSNTHVHAGFRTWLALSV
jgi:hypothetical protein